MTFSDKIVEIKKTLSDHEKRIRQLEKLLSGDSQIKLKKKSIKEFILEKKPSSAVKKTLAIGYYLEHFENVSPFCAADVINGFIKAREKPPINVYDKISKNIAQGFIMEAPEMKDGVKAYYLTSSGESFVENNFK